MLSNCDLSINLRDYYRNALDIVMAKPKRGTRSKILVVDEVIQEENKEEVQEELDGVVIAE